MDDTSDVTTEGISKEVTVALPTGDVTVPVSEAAGYIKRGWKVFDLDGRTLKIVKNSTLGTRRLAHGENVLDKAHEKEVGRTQAQSHLFRADGSRVDQPERQKTDYELGIPHNVKACKVPNCDDPAHFDLTDNERREAARRRRDAFLEHGENEEEELRPGEGI